MEQNIDIQRPIHKIYKERAIWVATFLGGPLAGGYLIAENFKAFNEINRARRTWIFAIITTIMAFGISFSIPDTVKIPNQIIPLFYTGIAYYFVHHFQGRHIEDHLNSDGHFFSWWRTIAIALIGLVITLLPIVGILLLLA